MAIVAVPALFASAVLLLFVKQSEDGSSRSKAFSLRDLINALRNRNILADSAEKEQLDHVFGFYYTLGFTLGSLSSIIFAYIVEILGFEYGFTYISAITAICLIPALFLRDVRP